MEVESPCKTVDDFIESHRYLTGRDLAYGQASRPGRFRSGGRRPKGQFDIGSVLAKGEACLAPTGLSFGIERGYSPGDHCCGDARPDRDGADALRGDGADTGGEQPPRDSSGGCGVGFAAVSSGRACQSGQVAVGSRQDRNSRPTVHRASPTSLWATVSSCSSGSRIAGSIPKDVIFLSIGLPWSA